MLGTLGDTGFLIAGSGIVSFTIVFLILVRWWSDLLGATIAGVVFFTSMVVILGFARVYNIDLPGGVDLWRAILYPTLGAFIWWAVIMMVWAQLMAPRINKRRKQ